MTNEIVVPEQLGRPEQMWRRAAALALMEASAASGYEYCLGDSEVSCSHSNGTWTLALITDGRALFYGQDVDCSDTSYRGDKPVDLLVNAPDWVPMAELRELNDGYELGYLYWWDEGAWARAPYPDFVADDGLEASCGSQSGLFDDAALAEDFADSGYEDQEAAERFIARVAARTVDAAALTELMATASQPSTSPREARLATALEWAARLGVAATAPTAAAR
ncbi:hypothetical protein AB0M39_35070 [Streptomyces sp. NPDC051907]|uniref:hypothetical protein n=1 Tax=Streptomyces sp. NPDC051907 TaxID=3155284 RepID=UPI00341BB31D